MRAVGTWCIILVKKQKWANCLEKRLHSMRKAPRPAVCVPHLCTLCCDGVLNWQRMLNGDPRGQVLDVDGNPGIGCSQGHLEARMAKNHLFFSVVVAERKEV